MPDPVNLVFPIRASLTAKMRRLLERPLVASIVSAAPQENVGGEDAFWHALGGEQFPRGRGAQASAWQEVADEGTFRVPVEIDYDGRWEGAEDEVRRILNEAVESPVYCLTEVQKALLERDPMAFVEAEQKPGTADLVRFEPEVPGTGGGGARVVALVLSVRPEGAEGVRYLAVVPNLVQLQRQLSALKEVEAASADGPLAPLRALVGLDDGGRVRATGAESAAEPLPGERLDEYQRACVAKAEGTPHFAVIQGPPGSGKTTVISSVVRRAVSRGERVLIVSPTHVAVDNVVEKLGPDPDAVVAGESDDVAPHTLPLRFAARPAKLSPQALPYWVGGKRQRRGATIARRVEAALRRSVPFAGALFDRVDLEAPGQAPVSATLACVEDVICGTPIGILSHEAVKRAAAGSFDLLVVDEVSKMTLPEFLAIAVKAKRWVLVGDPEQLPPYNDVEENGRTLQDLLDAKVELVCTLAAVLEGAYGWRRRELSLVVVTSSPAEVARAAREQLRETKLAEVPRIATLEEDEAAPILVCAPGELARARECLARAGHQVGRVLLERGVEASVRETDLVGEGERMASRLFDVCYATYHSLPWSRRAGVKLRHSKHRNGLQHYLPGEAALGALTPALVRIGLVRDLAVRYAVNMVSVYDWLTGMPVEHFDVSPLKELAAVRPTALATAVAPFVGTLKRQYRLGHASLSRVPREVFYFNGAMLDGPNVSTVGGPKVMFVQVEQAEAAMGAETNAPEADEIERALGQLAKLLTTSPREQGSMMVITPYKKQEELLAERVARLKSEHATLAGLRIDVCTLDRCQGKESDYVLVSLVKSRASAFMDMPKRWNVAVTRAKRGLVFVGDIDAYLAEARKARVDVAPGGRGYRGTGSRPEMSLPAYLMSRYSEAYGLKSERPKAAV